MSACPLLPSAPTIALQPPLAHDDPGVQSGAQTPPLDDVAAQSRFHSHESICEGSQAAPLCPWPFPGSQIPMSTPLSSKLSHSQTSLAEMFAQTVSLVGSHWARQTGDAPPSSTQSSPVLHDPSVRQASPSPPSGGGWQVSVALTQMSPLVQSTFARHCTQA